jgi:2,4-dienoyl-CoA reductase-like NADH-dependent reductase (Old Yellow Enzyme family)
MSQLFTSPAARRTWVQLHQHCAHVPVLGRRQRHRLAPDAPGPDIVSGAGLLPLEATAVEAIGQAQDLGCERRLTRPGYSCAQGAAPLLAIPIGIQLNHAGAVHTACRGSVSRHHLWRKVALRYGGASAPPLNLTTTTFEALTPPPRASPLHLGFSAQRASAWFQVIELHAAHGYLMHQFCRSLSNQRTDAYGGSLEDRMRFVLDVFDAVRAAPPASIPVAHFGHRLAGRRLGRLRPWC